MDTNLWGRLRNALASGAKKALSTILFLIKIMVPTSLVVALLGWSGILQVIAGYLSPLMRLVGLPGQAALVCLSSALLNIYSAIAVMGSLSLSLRDATILALMCLTAHNMLSWRARMARARREERRSRPTSAFRRRGWISQASSASSRPPSRRPTPGSTSSGRPRARSGPAR